MERIKPPEFDGRRLAEQARQLRKQAQGTPAGVERDKLVRKARLAETASRVSEWMDSKGLRPPT